MVGHVLREERKVEEPARVRRRREHLEVQRVRRDRDEIPDRAPVDGTARRDAEVVVDVEVDRGAIDRADFVGPTISLLSPRDNDADQLDQNDASSVVVLPRETILSNFVI